MGTQGKHWVIKDRQKYIQKYGHILTKEILLDATVRRISDRHLSEELQIPKPAILWYRKMYGIPSGRSDSEVRKIRNILLSDEEIGLIIGTVLGDGCLCYSAERDEAFLTIMHCKEQKEYVYHKYDKLKHLCLMPVTYTTCEGFGISEVYYFSTIWHPELAKLYKLLYPNGKKAITKEALNLLTIAGFVWWFFDNGSGGNNCYNLSTCQFPLEQQQLLREHLFKKYKIYTSIITDKRKADRKTYYSIYFAKRSYSILSDFLTRFIVPCMSYKIKTAPQRLHVKRLEN